MRKTTQADFTLVAVDRVMSQTWFQITKYDEVPPISASRTMFVTHRYGKPAQRPRYSPEAPHPQTRAHVHARERLDKLDRRTTMPESDVTIVEGQRQRPCFDRWYLDRLHGLRLPVG